MGADVDVLVEGQLDGLAAARPAALAEETPRVAGDTEPLGGTLDVLVDFAQEAFVAV